MKCDFRCTRGRHTTVREPKPPCLSFGSPVSTVEARGERTGGRAAQRDATQRNAGLGLDIVVSIISWFRGLGWLDLFGFKSADPLGSASRDLSLFP